MLSFLRALFVGGLVLVAMVPVGIAMLAVGLPIAILVSVALGAIVLVLALIGLPFIILGAILTAVIAIAFGVLAAAFALGAVALKLALLVLLPLLLVASIGHMVLGSRPKRRAFAGAPAAAPVDPYQRQAEAELDRELGV